MKASMKIATVTLIAAAACTGCADALDRTFPIGQSHAVSVLRDLTDSGLTAPTTQEVMNLYTLDDDHLYEGFTFRLRAVTASQDRPVVQYRVEPVRAAFATEANRLRQLKAFRSHASDAIKQSASEAVQPREYSLVYETLCLEAQAITSMPASTRTIIYYTDCLQNSEFSFYNPADFMQASVQPELTAQRFRRIASLPQMDGVHVYIVYRPLTYEQQKRFDVASNIFRLLLEEKGAKVSVVANITGHG